MFHHKVPTWAAVAACLLILFGSIALFKTKHQNTEANVITETVHDTIYKEKIVTEQIKLPGDTLVKYIYRNNPEIVYEVADYKEEEPSYENLLFREDEHCQIMSCYEPKKGVPVVNDTLLRLIPGNM